MATFSTVAQLQNGTTLALASTDHIWVNGTTFGLNIVAGNYQDSTHITDVNDVQRDTTASVNNTKWVTSSTVSLNSAAASALSGITTAQAPLVFTFSNGAAVATTAAKFYAYDGITDTTAITGLNFQAAEVTNSSWTAANGLGSALALADQGSATNHNYYVLFSASPTSPGAKTGAVKLTLTYS